MKKEIAEANPRQEVFILNPKISFLDCYDEVTKRIKQTKGIICGGNELIDDDPLSSIIRNYRWALTDILDEALFFLKVILEKSKSFPKE